MVDFIRINARIIILIGLFHVLVGFPIETSTISSQHGIVPVSAFRLLPAHITMLIVIPLAWLLLRFTPFETECCRMHLYLLTDSPALHLTSVIVVAALIVILLQELLVHFNRFLLLFLLFLPHKLFIQNLSRGHPCDLK